MEPSPASYCTCLSPLIDPTGRPVNLGRGPLVAQRQGCTLEHGDVFDKMTKAGGKRLSESVWLFPSNDDKPQFSFTSFAIMKESLATLHTEFGTALCIPETEYRMWLETGYCQRVPVVWRIDDVTWRVIASQEAEASNTAIHTSKAMHPTFRCYLEAHKEGGRLLEEVTQATESGTKDLQDHREFLFKVFHIVGKAPTLSHDLTKTTLLNFGLGRCFHSQGLELLQTKITFEDCMSLCRIFHLEIENHHPEHGEGDDVSVLDMYLDRVSRGVQKTHGWSGAAWHLPERYTPPAYRDAFSRLEHQYGHLPLADPGPIHVPTLLTGAHIAVKLEDMVQPQ